MKGIARRIGGAALLASFFAFSVCLAAMERAQYRAKLGIDEAEPALTTIRTHVEATYSANGKLCASSTLSSTEPFSIGVEHELSFEMTQAALDAEVAGQTGFPCLGIGTRALGSGEDMFSYESDGAHFVARAFRSYLFDPEGHLPRWELRGEVVDGHLVVDPTIYRIPPGGPSFLGHPQPRY